MTSLDQLLLQSGANMKMLADRKNRNLLFVIQKINKESAYLV